MDRSKQIIKTSIFGIIFNLVLVAFKMTVGLLSKSIAIILDAVNNLSDALSSIITIVGTKLAGKKPDKKHPYGYGRIEYLTSALIAVIVLTTGISSLKESVLMILHPEQTTYSTASLIVIAAAVIAKFFCGRYVKGVGEKLQSGALIASGSDAFFDSILSLGTLIIALISMFWDIALEGFLGVIIAAIIMKAGIEILFETIDTLIGVRADPNLTKEIKQRISALDGVNGAYDLILHNYGPSQTIGSVHIEVDDHVSAKELHRLTRTISEDIFRTYGIILTVGLYASNDSDEEIQALLTKIREPLRQIPGVLQLHGLYLDREEKQITFDLVIQHRVDPAETKLNAIALLEELVPGYRFDLGIDTDFSD